MVKPVYPVNVGKLNLINRLIVPVTYLDGQDIEIRVGDDDSDLGEHTITLSKDSVFGPGNIQYQAFFSPAKPGKVIWGIGPVFEFPTNTDDALGTDT